MLKNTLIMDSPLNHTGEAEMRQRFPNSNEWDEYNLPQMMRPTMSPALARFISSQPFFFIATANQHGHCDASFRGSETNGQGEPLPALLVLDERSLIFPDFSGNGLYNSLGNMATNPHIGMLFVDFGRQMRARVNGKTSLLAVDDAVLNIWPMAQAIIHVAVEQAYSNCPARIPKLVKPA
ncbi:MAG: pyridoxamine 5'-phosphate oxidase family protein [Neisseriaceae bacterium]|nr:pyridoxamine 5'-phosphate oxidase family protein [Neisseriaceae bacterium]MBP6861759.1 pyridoxamine 5'-phosphate oxidase family protein [Neisseriaceae bacterium]